MAFAEDGRIGKVDLSHLRATGVVAVVHSGKAIRSILLGFDEPLDPGAATSRRSYSLAGEKRTRHTIVFGKRVRIGRVSYNRTTNTVKLTLAGPRKGPLQVTVRVGGVSPLSDFIAIVESTRRRADILRDNWDNWCQFFLRRWP
jgi:hypothetical protein